MRVLFLSMYDPYAIGSGPGTHLRCLSQELSKLGCEVHILVLNPKKNSQITNGVHIHYLNSRFSLPVGKGILFPILSSRDVNKLCEKFEIDIIHGQSPSSFGYALSRNDDIPFIVTLHGTSFGEIASYFHVTPSCINPHLIRDAMFTQPLWAFLTYIEYKCADKIIAVSKAIAQETAKFYHLPEEKIVVIHNGVNLSSFSDSLTEEQNADHSILFVGRLIWRKGVKYLVDAMPHILSEYPDTKLVLVGNGEQKRFLQRRIKKLRIQNSVLFLSNISRERLYSLYREASVYVQPSLYEPCGIAILEAMSMGKPVVASRVGGIPELITNGKEGLLVEPRNSLQLARAITNIFSDESLRKKLANNATKKVLSEFTWKGVARKTLELYLERLNDN